MRRCPSPRLGGAGLVALVLLAAVGGCGQTPSFLVTVCGPPGVEVDALEVTVSVVSPGPQASRPPTHATLRQPATPLPATFSLTFPEELVGIRVHVKAVASKGSTVVLSEEADGLVSPGTTDVFLGAPLGASACGSADGGPPDDRSDRGDLRGDPPGDRSDLAGDRPGDRATDAPTDSLADAPADSLADAPVDSLADGPNDAVTDVPADMPRVLVPSHTDPAAYLPGAGDLTDPATIDTDALTVSPGGVPAGGRFVADSQDIAVLSVGKLIATANPVTVTGRRRLIVVASGEVVVRTPILASASRIQPGPGGFLPGMGPGAGGPGDSQSSNSSGGGGGSFGSRGAQGGDAVGGTPAGGMGGAAYGFNLSDFSGGSGGGHGGTNCGSGPLNTGIGGGGGGVVQISSAVSITIESGGGITAGGGGGLAGCSNYGGGGGGGSGGLIFLEAPTITLGNPSFLTANGGGGGGASSDIANGDPGDDGKAGPAAAAGGQGPAVGSGGNGATGVTSATRGTGGSVVGGGGGGGVGRIFLRTRGGPANIDPSAVISPAPMLDQTF